MFYRLNSQIVGEITQTEMIKEPIINSKVISPVGQDVKSAGRVRLGVAGGSRTHGLGR